MLPSSLGRPVGNSSPVVPRTAARAEDHGLRLRRTFWTCYLVQSFSVALGRRRSLCLVSSHLRGSGPTTSRSLDFPTRTLPARLRRPRSNPRHSFLFSPGVQERMTFGPNRLGDRFWSFATCWLDATPCCRSQGEACSRAGASRRVACRMECESVEHWFKGHCFRHAVSRPGVGSDV